MTQSMPDKALNKFEKTKGWSCYVMSAIIKLISLRKKHILHSSNVSVRMSSRNQMVTRYTKNQKNVIHEK